MRVIGLLNWFDEKPSWLAATVGSMSKLCDHVVAFDGAYGRFPSLDFRSSPEQAETIIRTADGLGMGWTVYAQKEKWWGGEVEKRAAMLHVASQIADPSDWFLILDADEILTDVWSGTRTQLSETDLDVAEVIIGDSDGGVAPIRRLFRALPNITTEQAHYVVTATKDGRTVVLCGDRAVHTQEPSLYLPDVKIIHRRYERDPERQNQKHQYYADAMPIEQRALEAIQDGGQAGADQGSHDRTGGVRVPSGAGRD